MKKHALLVGIDRYERAGITPLKFAAADVAAVGDRLRRVCGFDTVRIMSGTGGADAATRANVRQALQHAAHVANEEDIFLFAFAGHGIEVDGKGYLLTSDVDIDHADEDGLSLESLSKSLRSIRACQRVLLIDACRNDPHSGRGDAPNLMKESMGRDISALIGAAPTSVPTVTAIFRACSPGERAFEWEEKGHGVFTYFLLQAIDADGWRSGVLSLQEVARRTTQLVKQHCGRQIGGSRAQNPWFEFSGSYGSDIVLATREAGREVERVPEANRASGATSAASEQATAPTLRTGTQLDLSELLVGLTKEQDAQRAETKDHEKGTLGRLLGEKKYGAAEIKLRELRALHPDDDSLIAAQEVIDRGLNRSSTKGLRDELEAALRRYQRHEAGGSVWNVVSAARRLRVRDPIDRDASDIMRLTWRARVAAVCAIGVPVLVLWANTQDPNGWVARWIGDGALWVLGAIGWWAYARTKLREKLKA